MVVKQNCNKIIKYFLILFVVSISIFIGSMTNVRAEDDYAWDWEADASITPSTVINGNKITCSIADVVNGERTGGASLFSNDVGSLNITMYLYRYADADSTSYLSRKTITHTYSYDQFEWTYPSMRDQRDAFLTFDFTADKEYIGNYYYLCQYEWSGTVNYYSYSGTMNGTTHGGTRQRIAVNNARLTLNAYYNGGTFPDGDISKTFYTKYNDVYANRLNVYTGIQNSTVGTILKPKKDGYTFNGWYTSNLGGVKILNADNTFAQSSNTGYISYIGFSTWGMTEDKTLYAQFNDAITYSVYLNDGFGSTASTPAFYYKYGYSTQIGSDSSRRCYYFTNSSLSTCVNTPTNPLFYVTSEPAARTNYTFDGYYTGQKGTGTKYILSSGLATMSSPYLYEYTNNNNSNVTLYGNWKIDKPATPTITGGATKIYNASDTALTCSTTSTYGSGINLKYSFGYATSDGGTPSNWTTPATSNVYVIPKDSYVGQRWYSCRVYAEDSYGFISDTVASATTADTAMTINNASITFNVSSNGGTISGTSPLYSKYGVASLYTGIRNTTAGTIPTATKTGYTFNGWWTAASGGTKVINADKTVVASVSGWTNASKQFLRTANSTLYAQFTIANPATPTISGGATKIYNSTATTLTCATSTTYSNGINKYYSFGYATSDGGTPSNWTTPTTSNTLSIAKDAYVGQRWYSCRVYATDGTLTSSTVASATTADTAMTINNASITFNVSSNGGTISGTSPLYSKYGVASLYTGIRNTTAGTIPTATKTGYVFNGWWTEASGGTKVINADKTVIASVSGWTNASKQFLITANSTLYAQFTPNIYSVTLNNQSATTSGTPKVWYEYNTTKTINSETCYYYTDNDVTTCLSSYTITIPTKDHYIFDGYYTEPNGEGTKYVASTGVFTNNLYQKLPSEINNSYTDDITLYANWIAEPITVTLPDNTTESYHYGDSYTLGENNVIKENDNGALITFKYQDGETSDTTDFVTTSYTPNGWLINDVEHSDNEVIVLTEDIVIKYNYNKSYTSPIFPEPTRENYTFEGWFDSEVDGNKVESYAEEEDITLYARWDEHETITITLPDEIVYVPKGSEYNLGENSIVDTNRELYYVYMDYNYDDGSDPAYDIVYEIKEGNGWLVKGVHYDNNATITVNEDITVEYDFNYHIYPVSIPQNITREGYVFGGWYYRYTNDKFTQTEWAGEGDLDIYAKWISDPINLTIDGKTEIVERGYEYIVPNGKIKDNNYITIKISDWTKEYNNLPVKIGYGKSINYQTINGNNYEPGETYIVNEDTTVISNTNNDRGVVMDPYIEKPTTYEDEYGTYTFVGWILGNRDYIDPLDINTDIYTLTPEDKAYDGQEFIADYQGYDPETQVKVHIIDEFRRNDYIKIFEKGSTYNLEEDYRESTMHFDVGSNLNDDYFIYKKIATAPVDHYLVNGESYNPNTTITLNEDIELEYIRIITTSTNCGEDVCPDIINQDINTRYGDYIYRGAYTRPDGKGDLVDIKNATPIGDSYGGMYQTVYLYFVGDPNIILSIDDEVSIIEKGMGNIPEAKEKADDIIPITFIYNDGETPNEVRYITTSYEFEGYMKQNYWRVYVPGEEYDYEEDTYFYSSYNSNTTYDELPTIDDDHFKGWFTEPEGGDRIYSLEDMKWYYEDTGLSTLYAHWGEPTVEVCHGKGDCEEVIKGTAVTFERPEPTITVTHTTLNYNTDADYPDKEVTVTRTEVVEYYMINEERYDFGETYVFNENCDMYAVTTITETNDFEGYYNDNWDFGLKIGDSELRGWCATTNGRYCRHYDEGDNIVNDDGLTLYATYESSEGDTVKVTVDWNTTYDWPKGESELIPDEVAETINFEVPEDYYKDINFDFNDGSGNIETGRIAVTNEFSHFRVGNDDSKKYQQHDLYTFYRNIHIQSQYNEVYGEIEFPEMNEPTFKGWYTKPDGGKKISNTDDFVKYMDFNNELTLYAQYYEGLPTDFSIDSEDITLLVGQVHSVEVTFTPEGTEDTITYTGYDENIISVSNGIITGLEKGETTITVGLENVDVTKEITVTVISDKLESDIYEVREKENNDTIIIGADPETTIAEFKDKLLNSDEYIKIYDKDDNLLSDEDIVKTGLKIKLEYNGLVLDETVMVVRGDVDGDGFVNISDYILVANHALEEEYIDDYIMFTAADVEEDEILNIADYIKIMDYALENTDSLNN